MSRTLFNAELGFGIYAENGVEQAYIISGTAAPDGTSGKQSEAPIGSLYLRSGTGELYQKIANASAPADWQLNGATSSLGVWRSEFVRAATNDTLAAGNTDPSTWTDNDDGLTDANFAVNDYVIGDADGTAILYQVTAISSPNITLAVASPAMGLNDMFAVRYNLPDPSGQENQAILIKTSSIMVKVADIDWAVATGIVLSGAYVAAAGVVASGDSVQAAIAKLDGNQQEIDQNVDDLITLSGVAENATNLGTFTGDIITDNSTVKGALQELETELVDTRDNVDDLITLSGVAENAVDLGTFTGDIISDNTTVKGALQELETELVDTRDNVDDLITLSGVAENATDFGTFTGTLLADNQTAKALFQRIEDLLEEVKVLEVTGITTVANVDVVPVADASAVKWLVEAFEEAAPANKQALEVYALNNGTLVDESVSNKLKVGSNFNLSISVDISGTDMRLRAASTSAGVTVRARRIEVTNI